jgi:sulfhydrogenase subunit beta (sulfur reductase)
MLKKDIDKLAVFIAKQYDIYAPVLLEKDLKIQRVENIEDIDYSARIPDNTFKQLFLPDQEELFSWEKGKLSKSSQKKKRGLAAFGMTVIDLKALGLFDLVFAKDPYYLAKRENNITIGISSGAPSDFEEYKVFSMEKEENVLEHIPFDIFVERNTDKEFKIYSGSVKGRKVLRLAGIGVFENIQFAGLIPEEGPDQRMMKLMSVVKGSENNPVWEEIAKKCIACGKCSTACPTCFCFDLLDESKSDDTIVKKRIWGNCFYPEFSQVAGSKRFVDTVKQKLFFWYEHKFSRTPAEYKVPGCVSCMRCFKACPVGINIIEVLNKLEKKND